MESSEDKQWASKYLLDPLNAPEPSAETGPGTHHNISTQSKEPTSRFSTSTITSAASSQRPNDPAPSVTVRSSAALPSEKTGSSINTTANPSVRSSNNPYSPKAGYPTPPGSASPHAARFPDLIARQSPQTTGASTQIPTSTGGANSSSINGSAAAAVPDSSQGHRRRTSSLKQRHPGDQTHRPLDMLKQDDLRANRAPHLRQKPHVGADSIDTLDNVGPASAYHHEGPYDATLLARNMDPKRAPVAAVREGNVEALKATPRELVEDSLKKHRPLDGVAVVPPGMVGPGGKVMQYEEGTDMMVEGQPEGGPYRRWPGIKYLPNDHKAKGEPSFSLEKALKSHRRNASESQAAGATATATGLDTGTIEMTTRAETRRPLSVGGGSSTSGGNTGVAGQRYADWERERERERQNGASGTASGSGSGSGAGGGLGRSASVATGSATGAGTGMGMGGKLRKKVGSLRGRN